MSYNQDSGPSGNDWNFSTNKKEEEDLRKVGIFENKNENPLK